MQTETLIKEGKLKETPEMNHVAFLLENSRLFLNSDYRFMKGQEQSGLLRCMKVLQNGKIKLIYLTDGLRPLSVLYGCMNFSAFLSVLENIFSTIRTVEDNGFLKPKNIEESLAHIFLDPKTLETRLLYLPLQISMSDSGENYMAFRSEIVRLIHATPLFTGSDVRQACSCLENEALNAEGLRRELQNIRTASSGTPHVYEEDDPVHGTRQLAANIRLTGRDPSCPVSFHIHKSEYVIGKSQEKADGVIAKGTVSRIHCAIYFINNAYYVEDLDSTNGTRLNHERLPSRQRRQLMNGDILSIAGSEFLVEY